MQEIRRTERPRLRRARDGFTVVETLLVLSVLGIVISFALPRVGRSLASSRADRTAAVVAADIKVAFSLAARQKAPVRLSLDAGQRRYEILDRATSQRLLLRVLDGSAGDMAVTSLTSTRDWIDVFPNGLASHAVAYTIQIGENRRLISMTRTGHVKVMSI